MFLYTFVKSFVLTVFILNFKKVLVLASFRYDLSTILKVKETIPIK